MYSAFTSGAQGVLKSVSLLLVSPPPVMHLAHFGSRLIVYKSVKVEMFSSIDREKETLSLAVTSCGGLRDTWCKPIMGLLYKPFRKKLTAG